MTRCSFIVPCFNEEAAVPIFMATLPKYLNECRDIEPEYVFVDDGSRDKTLEILKKLQLENPQIVIVELSRNFGKEAALSAGLAQASGDIVIPIDVDLQDPPEVVPQMIAKWREGYDVVLAKRATRKQDTFFKRFTANSFYRFINYISPIHIPENVGDFRLMNRQVVDVIKNLPENFRLMIGIFAFVGFRSAVVEFDRPKRSAGITKFTLWKSLMRCLDCITGFSIAPLRLWGSIGFLLAIVAIIIGLFYFLRTLFFGVDIPGYASLIVATTLLGGIQLMGIGLIGEYLGRTYIESKNRPPYIVRKVHLIKDRANTVKARFFPRRQAGKGSCRKAPFAPGRR